MKRSRRALIASSLVLGLLPGLAAANSWTWRDRDDQDRPLSIASVTAGHVEDPPDGHMPTVTVTFDQPLRPEEMGPKDFVIVLIDSDGKEPNEEWIYLIAVDGRLERVSYNPHSDEASSIYEGTFRFPTPESVEIDVTRFAPGEGHIFAAGSYTESAPGCAQGCWDWAPNRGGLIHDWTPPWVRGMTEPSPWTFQRTLKINWEVSDVGLSGFRKSSLMMSEPGSGKWHAVATRKKPGRYKVFVRDLNQGSNVLLRPVAQDGANNKTIGPIRRTRVPWDQANPNGPGTLAGMWREEMRHAFGGTVHTSTAPGDSMTFAATGNLYCVYAVWGPDPAQVTFEVGGETIEYGTPGGTGYTGGYPICIDAETVDERTATLTVHAGLVSVDWYWAGIYPSEIEATPEEAPSGDQEPAPEMPLPKGEMKTGSEAVRTALSRS